MNSPLALALFVGCVFLLVYTYGIYPLLLLLIPRRRKRACEEITDWPGVSILMSVFNEEKHIAARIENLLALDYPPEKLEVLIGSDASTDRTEEIVHRYVGPRVSLHRVTLRGGKPRVLKHLVPKARYALLAFTDANSFWQPDALKKLVRHFQDARVGGVCGRLVFRGDHVATHEDPYWRLETFLKSRESDLDSCLGANGAIYAIRRCLWPQIPDNTFVDDFVIGMQVREQGFRLLYESDAVATEELPPTVSHEMTRRIRIGAGDFQALRLCWRSLLPWRGLYVWSFWSHKVLRWLGPFLMIGAFASNCFLLRSPFFVTTLSLQILFYLMALAGAVAPRKFVLFSAPRYFVVINLALLFGFFRYLTGTQPAAWQRTER